MKKLTENSEKNSPSEYDLIFSKRKLKGVDEFDLRRWYKLLKFYQGGKLVDLATLDSLVPSIAHRLYPHAEIWGIDLAEQAVMEMRRKFPYINYEVRDVYDTKFKDGEFDYVVAGEVLEHLEHPERFLKESVRILKPGGTLALSTPLNEAIEPGAVDKDRHLWSWDEKDMQDLLGSYGTVKIQVLRSVYLPRYKYCFPQMCVFLTKN
jgi:2-polyprenyl-3-methyl-5-hydroxy-6-metoxy-1,4-benzoquinol methylase